MACGGQDPDEYKRVYEGESIAVYSTRGEDICARTFTSMEGYLNTLQDFTGVSIPQDEKIIHYWPWSCGDELEGCAAHLTSYSAVIPHEHELAHNILAHNLGAPFLFREGSAVVLSGAFFDGGDPSAIDPDELAARNGPPDGYPLVDSYASAARFNRFLLDEYGVGALLEILDATSSTGPDEIPASVTTVTGVEWTTLLAKYRAIDICPEIGYRLWLTECSAPTVAPIENQWEIAEKFSCETNAIGSVDKFWITRTIDIDPPGEHEITFVADPGVYAEIGSCGGCSAPLYVGLHEFGSTHTINMDAGKYFVRILGSGEHSSRALVRITSNTPQGP